MKASAGFGLTISALLLASSGAGGQQLTITQSPTCASAQAPLASQPVADSMPRADTTGAIASNGQGKPDVVLLVAFSADEIRFNSAPSAAIRLCWGGDSLHVLERRNLPSPVMAGTTYRNVYIAAELRAYLNPECLSRAFGGSAPASSNTADPGCAALGLTTAAPSVSRPAQPAH
jgi:hypothetical protein